MAIVRLCIFLYIKYIKLIITKIIYVMNETIKNYEAPQCEVIEMELQGMIAASGEPTLAPPSFEPIGA